jgi:hypothetical protein
MPSQENGIVVSGNKYSANRRIVMEFGAFVAAHLKEPLRLNVEPFAVRTIINDVMKSWIDNEYKCTNPSCLYCMEHRPSPDFRRRFRDKLGSKSEMIGYRRKEG